WPFVSHFEHQLSAGAEQQAFRRATMSCDDVPPIMEYAMTYPAGRYRPALQEFVAACDTSRGGSWPPPTKINGRGWELH
ncbi:hypothetical protein, partial [Escherichia coli]|uniref:hypothetical protein n=1 Tax=Escherichia coli TaxID=562 RepID=UPI001954BD0A